MASVKFYKVSTLPGSLVADALYFVENGGYAESYITDSSGVAKSIGNSAMINSLVTSAVSTAIAGLNQVEVVADIAARNAMGTASAHNLMILVLDATGDTTVAAGAATYVFEKAGNTYTKVAEYESLDLTLTWASIVGGPTSSPANIDSAVALKHSHANKSTLDLIGANSDGLTYNGSNISSIWSTLSW